MPYTTPDARDWILIFEHMAAQMEIAKDRLNELDGAIGDGDHGVTMSIGFRAVNKALQGLNDDVTIDKVFAVAGKAFLSAAGGAVGPLMGSMWIATAKVLPGCTRFGAPECRQMLQTMETAIVQRGKAKPGDKTMLDALHPAVQAAVGSKSDDVNVLMQLAANAAWSGAHATARLISRMGRSRGLGERTAGHEDAGANSMAIILTSIADTIRETMLAQEPQA
jgi:dihydroxyacetone kinase-like protein